MSVRLDKWLWAARFFKTRGLAAGAIKGGRVHVNGAQAKPAKEVVPGDRIQITISGLRREVVVRAVGDRRGSASIAATLFEETPASIAERERRAAERRLLPPPQEGGGARPTKRDRRRLEQLRGRDRDG